jgi:hypothetical protein
MTISRRIRYSANASALVITHIYREGERSRGMFSTGMVD